MNRSLACLLAAISLQVFVISSIAFASTSQDGARGRAILRLHGGGLSSDPDLGDGPGWLAGGAVGMGLGRDVILTANYDHFHIQKSGNERLDVDPVTLQLEFGNPFQGWISPRLEIGGGVYVRSLPPNPVLDPAFTGIREYGRRTDSPFGANLGFGLSFLVSPSVMLDLGARYHQLSGSDIFTTLSAGLTVGLSGESHDGEWTSKATGTVLADR